MKKVFTFVCALMAVGVAAIAEESISGASTWSPWNPDATTIEVSGQQTIMKFTEAWSGAGYWMGIDEDEDGLTDFWPTGHLLLRVPDIFPVRMVLLRPP